MLFTAVFTLKQCHIKLVFLGRDYLLCELAFKCQPVVASTPTFTFSLVISSCPELTGFVECVAGMSQVDLSVLLHVPRSSDHTGPPHLWCGLAAQ